MIPPKTAKHVIFAMNCITSRYVLVLPTIQIVVTVAMNCIYVPFSFPETNCNVMNDTIYDSYSMTRFYQII